MTPSYTGIIVVNYNSGPETIRLAHSLQRLSHRSFSFCIVDNCSPDESGEELKREIPWAEHIAASENRGFAAGVNLGLSHFRSRAEPPEFLWILNPDMEVSEKSLSTLISTARETGGVVGPKILYPSPGGAKIWAAGGFIDFDRLETSMRGNSQPDGPSFNTRLTCDYLPGCSLLIPRSVLDWVGNMPEEYFLYFEETDWCLRAKKQGVPLVYEPAAEVTHFFREAKLSEPLVTYYYNRNRRVFFYRYASLAQRIALFFRALFVDLPQAKRSLKEAPDERYRALFQAHRESCIDFLLNRLGKRPSSRER